MTPAQIVVQSSHAAFEAAKSHSCDLDHPHFVVLGIRNQEQLENALERTRSLGIDVFPFYESDRNDELTSFSTESIFEHQRYLFKKYNCLKDSSLIGGVK